MNGYVRREKKSRFYDSILHNSWENRQKRNDLAFALPIANQPQTLSTTIRHREVYKVIKCE